MSKKLKNPLLMSDDEKYAKSQKHFKEYRENKIKKLDLTGLALKAIPPEIAELETLEELIIRNDSIEIIPVEISSLKKLRKLEISCEKIKILPDELGELYSLASLNLSCPQLRSLPDSFANLKAMEAFRFEACNLSAIPDLICGWSKLKLLEIEMANTFHGPYTALKNIPSNIGKLKNLKHLSLIETSIAKIPDSLGNCPLEFLELAGEYKTMPESFGNLSKLKTLKLISKKPITLPNSFGRLSSLKNLEIRSPGLTIPDSFNTLAALEELSIMSEEIALTKNLCPIPSMNELHIYAREMQDLPASIGECKNLRLFFLSSDKLTALPDSFCELKKLEELHLDTFALKALPAGFGRLTSLKYIDIFSGALTALPESMGSLKKINNINLDVYNLKKLPNWFEKLSYIEHMDIQTGKEDSALHKSSEEKKGLLGFHELIDMSHNYLWKTLESCSVKEIESILCSAPSSSLASEAERFVFKDMMLTRSQKLDKKFKWTAESKKKIIKVSDEFLKAWEDGFIKAKIMTEALHKKNKDSQKQSAAQTIKITLYPEILDREPLYDAILSYLDAESELSIRIDYDPVKKDESDFRENIFVNRDLSWNIEGLGDMELQDNYICHALHVLYSDNDWAIDDIIKINNIITEIKISFDNEGF